MILAGGGVLRARTSTDLLQLAELLDVPVIAGWRRGDVISNDHPLYLGMAGYGAPSVVRERLEAADALLVIGCRLSEITSYGYAVPTPGQRWAHVDIEPLGGAAGPRAARAHGPRRRPGVPPGCGRAARGGRARRRGCRRPARRQRRGSGGVGSGDRRRRRPPGMGPASTPGTSIATLRRLLPDDAIVATDAGNFGLWLARHFRFRKPGTFLGPTSGAMGYGLPAAIAAALVHRDRAVVAVAGDGGFAMTMAELETAVREKARVVAIVFDNERYGTIRMHQERRSAGDAAGSSIATDLGPVDFAAIARAVRRPRDAGRDGRRVRAGASPGARRGPADGPSARPRPALGEPGPDSVVTVGPGDPTDPPVDADKPASRGPEPSYRALLRVPWLPRILTSMILARIVAVDGRASRSSCSR